VIGSPFSPRMLASIRPFPAGTPTRRAAPDLPTSLCSMVSVMGWPGRGTGPLQKTMSHGYVVDVGPGRDPSGSDASIDPKSRVAVVLARAPRERSTPASRIASRAVDPSPPPPPRRSARRPRPLPTSGPPSRGSPRSTTPPRARAPDSAHRLARRGAHRHRRLPTEHHRPPLVSVAGHLADRFARGPEPTSAASPCTPVRTLSPPETPRRASVRNSRPDRGQRCSPPPCATPDRTARRPASASPEQPRRPNPALQMRRQPRRASPTQVVAARAPPTPRDTSSGPAAVGPEPIVSSGSPSTSLSTKHLAPSPATTSRARPAALELLQRACGPC
jgi:hypothetical protein